MPLHVNTALLIIRPQLLVQAEPPTEKQKQPKQQPAKKEINAAVDMLDIRVGQIVSVSRHPDADALYVEEIDIGEEQPRQVTNVLLLYLDPDNN